METKSPLIATLKAVLDAFNAHDLDRVMSFFSEECVLETPPALDPWGTRYAGLDAVREGLRTRLEGNPNVQYTDDTHFVVGNVGISQWTLRGTSVGGDRVEMRGCDFFTFKSGKIVKKDSYWKTREGF